MAVLNMLYNIEKLNVKLCKYVLGASRKSCNDAVRGELGRYHVLLMTMNQWFKYAKHCYSLPCDNFSRASLSGLCDYTTYSPYRNWSSKIYDVISFVYCGFDVVFNENALHHPALPLYVQEHSMLKYKRAWLSSIYKGYNPNKPNKLKVYASIKKSFSLENYVSCYNIAKRRNFTKLRISSHHLAIEKGRYTRPIIPREQRFCNTCSDKVIGDEMHFLLGCPKFVSERGRLFYDLGQSYGLRNNGDFLTFNLLMNYGFGDTHMAGKILKYVNECFNTWECKSWSEIIFVTTTGFCVIVCCMSLCLLCM